MPGTPLDTLTVLVESEGPAWRTSAEEMVNDAVRRNYTISRIAGHKDIKDIVRGGDSIQDRIFLSTTKRLSRYNPNATLTGQLTNPGINYTVPWSFGAASISFTKQHLGLNIESMGRTYRAQKYKDVMRQLKMELWTGVHETLEEECWAAPDFTNMESGSATTRKPLSIPALVNEFQDGLPIGLAQTSWTTKQQINPAVAANTRWNCYQSNYTYDAAAASGAYPLVLPLFTSMGKALRRTGLDQLPMNKEYSDKRKSPHCILTQEAGVTNFEFALLSSQDHFRGMGMRSGQDPAYPGPSYRGIPVQWIESLDDAAIYPTGTGGGETDLAAIAWSDSEDGSVTAVPTITNIDGETVNVGQRGPRYYLMNLEHFHWACHQNNYLVPGPVITPSDKPFSRVQWWDLWNCMYASSLRTSAILTPAADTTNA